MANVQICVFNPVTTLIDQVASASAGPGVAGQPVVLNSQGVLDPSLLGQGVIATAGQNLSAGNLVNLYEQGGTLRMQLASATNGGTSPSGATYPVPANGFVSSQIFTGFTGIVSFSGTFVYIDGNTEFSANDIGTIVFLSAVTPGGVTKTAPSATYPITSCNNASGPNTTYNGTFTATSLAGYSATVTGFVNAQNNGTFLVISNSPTTLVLSNASGVAETHAASVTISEFTQSVGYVVGFTAPNKVTVAFSAAFLDFTQINGVLPIPKGGTGGTTGAQALMNLIGGAPATGDALIWNGSAWVPSATPVITGTIATTQVAFGSGTNTITGNPDLTYTAPTLTFRNTGGINTNPSTINKDGSDNFQIVTGTADISMAPGGNIALFAGGAGHPQLNLAANGNISLQGINTGSIDFFETTPGFQGGQGQIVFDMFQTGSGPHGVWAKDDGSRASVFLQTSDGSVYMQNIVGANDVLSQVGVSGGTTTYTGTFPTGGSNQLAGKVGSFSGFTNSGNNVTATITASSGTTLQVATTTQVNEIHAGTVIINMNSPTITLVGSVWNGSAFVDDLWTIKSVTGAGTLPGQTLVINPNQANSAVSINSTLVTGQINCGAVFTGGSVDLTSAAATNVTNISSYLYELSGAWWNGSASVTSTSSIQSVIGTGVTPTEVLRISNSGAFAWGGVSIANTTPSTAPGTEFAAPSLNLDGTYWTGSASALDRFSLDVTMQGNAIPSQASATLTLNHTGSNIAYFTMGPQIFRFTSAGENVLGTVTAEAVNIETEQTNGATFVLSSVDNAVGNLTTYHGPNIVVIPPQAGAYVTMSGFTNLSNNGRFIVQSSVAGSPGTVTVYNSAGVAETHTGLLTFDSQPWFFGNISSMGFGEVTGLHILGTAYNVTMGTQAEPATTVPFVVTMAGNAQDAAYMRIVNDGGTGEHGLEMGAIIDGTGAAPVFLQLGKFGGVPAMELSSTTASTAITLGVPAPAIQLSGTVWNGSASIADEWAITHVPSWNISQGATTELVFKHNTAGANTSVVFDNSVQSVFGQSTSWAIGPTSVTSLITPTGLIGFAPALTAAANAVGNTTTYTWNISPSTAANITAGMYFTISGFTNISNNGRFQVQSTPTATSLVVFNSSGVAETHAATATIDNPYTSGGVWLLEGDIGIGHFPIVAASPGINQNIIAAPNTVALAITTVGDHTDAGYMRIINTDPTTGNHGLEIGAIIDGTGAAPITLQMGNFSGTPEVVLNTDLNAPSVTLGASKTATVQVPISSADLLAMPGTVKTLISAPGSGKILIVHSVVFQYIFNTTPYTPGNADNNLQISYGSTPATYWEGGASINLTGFLDQSSNQISVMDEIFYFKNPGGVQSYPQTAVDNQTLVLTITGTTPGVTLGNGTVKLTIEYSTVTL